MTTKVLGIEISNPNRIIYPGSNITKLDVVKYYATIAPLMLPFVEDRLLSAVRCHKSINDDCFFKKHLTETNPHLKPYKKGDETYFYVTSQKGIITEAQNGTIEFHTSSSTINNPTSPNFMVFDLDPDENLSLENLRAGAKLLKTVLDKLNLKSFLKTSGGKGYHIIVPFSSSKGYTEFKAFAKNIALFLEKTNPELFTTTIKKSARKNKIFIDYLRNDTRSTCIAPYSLRARPNAPISFPISWQNLNKIAPNQITIKSYKKYLTQNPWKNFENNNIVLK